MPPHHTFVGEIRRWRRDLNRNPDGRLAPCSWFGFNYPDIALDFTGAFTAKPYVRQLVKSHRETPKDAVRYGADWTLRSCLTGNLS